MWVPPPELSEWELGFYDFPDPVPGPSVIRAFGIAAPVPPAVARVYSPAPPAASAAGPRWLFVGKPAVGRLTGGGAGGPPPTSSRARPTAPLFLTSSATARRNGTAAEWYAIGSSQLSLSKVAASSFSIARWAAAMGVSIKCCAAWA